MSPSEIQIIESQIQRRNAARDREAEMRRQAQVVATEIETARAKVADLKSNDTESLTEAARQLTEAETVIELGMARRERALREATDAAREAQNAESSARAEIKKAFGYLTSYRQHKRLEDLKAYIAGWISPECISGNSQILPFLKKNLISLAATDRALDRVSQTSGGFAAGQGVLTRSAICSGYVDDDLAYLRVVAPELEQAIAWEAEDSKERVRLSAQAPWQALDQSSQIHLYTK